MGKRKLNVVIGNYAPRGTMLGNSFMAKNASCFVNMMKYAQESESGLDIQLRGKEMNIYYEGGSLLKLSGKSNMYLDENYFYQPPKNSLRMTDIERLCHKNYVEKVQGSKYLKSKSKQEIEQYRKEALEIKKNIKCLRDEKISKLKNSKSLSDVQKAIDEMKLKMHNWKVNLQHNKIRKDVVGERVVQHYLSLYNKESEKNSQFIILDLEYAISTNAQYAKENEREKQPRIDIVAIEKSSGQLYVMELKFGMKSVGGDASAKKHYDDYLQTIGKDDKWEYFLEDIKKLLRAKQSMNIISENVSIMQSKPIFAYIMKCTNLSDEKEFKRHLRSEKLDFIPTIYLQPELDYEKPSKEGHILRF